MAQAVCEKNDGGRCHARAVATVWPPVGQHWHACLKHATDVALPRPCEPLCALRWAVLSDNEANREDTRKGRPEYRVQPPTAA